MKMKKSTFAVGIIGVTLVIGFLLAGCVSVSPNILDNFSVGKKKVSIGYDYFDTTVALEEQSILVVGQPKLGRFYLTSVDGVKTGMFRGSEKYGVGEVTIFQPGNHTFGISLFKDDGSELRGKSIEVEMLPGSTYYITSDVEVMGPLPAGIRWLEAKTIDEYDTVRLLEGNISVADLTEGIKTAVNKRLTQGNQ